MFQKLRRKIRKFLDPLLPLELREEYKESVMALQIFAKDGIEVVRFVEKTGKTYVRRHPDLIMIDEDKDFPILD